MRVTITTSGSRGDVQPYVALGVGLARAGHEVTLTAPAAFGRMITDRGLAFHPVAMDPLEGVRRELEDGDANLLRFAWRARDILGPPAREDLRAFRAACRDAEAVVYSSVGFLGFKVAGDLGIPRVGATYGPLLNPTRQFPCSFMPVPSGLLSVPGRDAFGSLRGFYNRLSYPLAQQALWQPMRAPINSALRDEPGSSPFPFSGPFAEFERSRGPVLNGWSRHVLPHPPGWAPRITTTGYWFLDRPPEWRPSPNLVDFLESGPPPVSVGFGSMAGADPEGATKLVLRALRLAGKRGVLLTGWGGLSNAELPDDLFEVGEVPHDWLFPRVAAAVHHGGAGTTAASLRAGTPTVIVPHFADQFFWGARVAGLGAGPRPVPRAKLTAERLAEAIRRATGDARVRECARSLGEKIRAENGVERAVEAFGRYAGFRR